MHSNQDMDIILQANSRGLRVIPRMRRSKRNQKSLKCMYVENEEKFKVKMVSKDIGLGVFASESFPKGEFLMFYKGMEFNCDPSTEEDDYIFEYFHKGKKYWIDASADDGSLGRLLNDDHISPNCFPKVVEIDGSPKIGFFTRREVKVGEELRYCYGGKSSDYPWRRDRKLVLSTCIAPRGRSFSCLHFHLHILYRHADEHIFLKSFRTALGETRKRKQLEEANTTLTHDGAASGSTNDGISSLFSQDKTNLTSVLHETTKFYSTPVQDVTSILTKNMAYSTSVQDETNSTSVRGEIYSTSAQSETISMSVVVTNSKSIQGETNSTLFQDEFKSTSVQDDTTSASKQHHQDETNSTLVQDETKFTSIQDETSSEAIQDETNSISAKDETNSALIQNDINITSVQDETHSTSKQDHQDEPNSTLVQYETNPTSILDETNSTLVQDETNSTSIQDKTNSVLIQDDTNSTSIQDETNSASIQDETNSIIFQDETNSALIQDETNSTSVQDETNSTLIQDETNSTSVQDKTKSASIQDETISEAIQCDTYLKSVHNKTASRLAYLTVIQDKTCSVKQQEKAVSISSKDKTNSTSAQGEMLSIFAKDQAYSTSMRDEGNSESPHSVTNSASTRDETYSTSVQYETYSTSVQGEINSESIQDDTDLTSIQDETSSKCILDKTNSASAQDEINSTSVECETNSESIENETNSALVQDESNSAERFSTSIQDEANSPSIQIETNSKSIPEETYSVSALAETNSTAIKDESYSRSSHNETNTTQAQGATNSTPVQDHGTSLTLAKDWTCSATIQDGSNSRVFQDEIPLISIQDETSSTSNQYGTSSGSASVKTKSSSIQDETYSTSAQAKTNTTSVHGETNSASVLDEANSVSVRDGTPSKLAKDFSNSVEIHSTSGSTPFFGSAEQDSLTFHSKRGRVCKKRVMLEDEVYEFNDFEDAVSEYEPSDDQDYASDSEDSEIYPFFNGKESVISLLEDENSVSSTSELSELYSGLPASRQKRPQQPDSPISFVQSQTNPESTLSTDPNVNSSKITVSCTNNVEGRKWDKVFFCPYCDVSVAKLPRHMKSHHKNEADVCRYMNESDKSRKNAILCKLRNLGNHRHNCSVLQKQEGVLIVAYRPAEGASPCDYVPCQYCLGYYRKTDLWRHTWRCVLAPADRKKHIGALNAGRLLLPSPQGTSAGLKSVLCSMKSDEVSRIIKGDPLILALGEKKYLKTGHDREQFNYIRNVLREVGRLLKRLREIKSLPSANLQHFINPGLFADVVHAARLESGFSDESHLYETPSLALKLGHSLKTCCTILRGNAIKNGDETLQKTAENFLEILNMNWTDEVSTHALRTLYQKKRNKVKLIPLVNDVMLLTNWLKKNGEEACHILQNEMNYHAWVKLNKIVLTQLILFNRKRQGEASKMKLEDFASRHHSDSQKAVLDSLSQLERKLTTVMERVEIIGKRGRSVPVLLPSEAVKKINILSSYRTEVGIPPENDFVFPCASKGSVGHIRGSDTLKHFSDCCGAEHPELLKSTGLRKQIGTLCQILNLKENELDILADFMGHDIRVHREFYRLPYDTMQVVKVSKLLMRMEKGTIPAGKSLDEIEVHLEDEVEEDPEDCLEDDDTDDESRDEENKASEDKMKPGCARMSMESRTLPPSPAFQQVSDKKSGSKRQKEVSALYEDDQMVNANAKVRRLNKNVQEESRNAKKSILEKSTRPKVPRGSCRPGVKRTWTEEEKRAVAKHFKRDTLYGTRPGKHAFEDCIAKEPSLKRRTWRNIKDYIRNNRTRLLNE